MHCGQMYNGDKELVYLLLTQYSKDSKAEAIVDRYHKSRDNRKAYEAIITYMQSTNYKDNLCTNALAKIAKATYSGKKKEFGITKYYMIHNQAHNDLATGGQPMTDVMKITNFCNSIKDPVTVNYAITTKTDPNVDTFEKF